MARPGAGAGAVAREKEPVRADVGQAGGASDDEMGPFPCAPHDRSPRWGMSIGPFACIHIEGQSSQNGGSGAPSSEWAFGGSSEEAEHLWRSRSLASVFFCPFRSLALD